VSRLGAEPPRTPAPLLSLSAVGRRLRQGASELVVLEQVSFELHAGEGLGIYGGRRSGKSTLARLAAGLERPDEGSVRFDGRPVASRGRQAGLLRGPVALLTGECRAHGASATAIDYVALAAGSAGLSLRQARRTALATLDRVGVAGVSAEALGAALSPAERARVLLAGALVHEPRLLIVDEPAPLPSLIERERFCALLRELARERGIALLVLSEELSALQGLAALATLSRGELCFAREPGTVVELPRGAARGGP
jgi:ABC-type multidrug transport system ATPase subunit